jgi:hypothetical protein
VQAAQDGHIGAASALRHDGRTVWQGATESRSAGATTKRGHPSSAIGVLGARARRIWSVKRNRTVEGRAGHGTRSHSAWRVSGRQCCCLPIGEPWNRTRTAPRRVTGWQWCSARGSSSRFAMECARAARSSRRRRSGRLGRCWASDRAGRMRQPLSCTQRTARSVLWKRLRPCLHKRLRAASQPGSPVGRWSGVSKGSQDAAGT